MNKTTPTRANVVVLKQMLNLIPRGMINRHALETGVEAKARSFTVLSHLSAMLFAQLSHAIGLNDVCDWLRLKSGVLEMAARVNTRPAPDHRPGAGFFIASLLRLLQAV